MRRTRPSLRQADAAQDAVVEQERVDTLVSDKERLWSEQQEKARVRGDSALKREVLDNVSHDCRHFTRSTLMKRPTTMCSMIWANSNEKIVTVVRRKFKIYLYVSSV